MAEQWFCASCAGSGQRRLSGRDPHVTVLVPCPECRGTGLTPVDDAAPEPS